MLVPFVFVGMIVFGYNHYYNNYCRLKPATNSEVRCVGPGR
jgi:hypothetical protein